MEGSRVSCAFLRARICYAGDRWSVCHRLTTQGFNDSRIDEDYCGSQARPHRLCRAVHSSPFQDMLGWIGKVAAAPKLTPRPLCRCLAACEIVGFKRQFLRAHSRPEKVFCDIKDMCRSSVKDPRACCVVIDAALPFLPD